MMHNFMLRFINIGLLLTFSLGYMEWGQGYSSYIFEITAKLFSNWHDLLQSLVNPLILAGLAGHIILIWCAFQEKPNRKLNIAGILILTPVIALVLLAGALSGNWKMILSALPFTALVVAYFVYSRNSIR